MNNIQPTDLLQEISNFITDTSIKDHKKLLKLLNLSPKPDWVREHPYAKGVKYIPIGIVETLLARVFGRVRIEVKDTKIIANSVAVTVRVHYYNPAFWEWDYQDWLGAMPIQVDKGKNPIAFEFIKSNSIQLALPCAKSYAIKDACEHLWALFGRDLNRKEHMEYADIYPEALKLDNLTKHE